MPLNITKISASGNIPKGTISKCRKYLDNIGQINQNSVRMMPEDIKEFLRKYTPIRLKELAKMNCYAAQKVKNTLDNQYGCDNYVLIALGRSVASIVELIGNLGRNTKIIPLSGIKKITPKDIDLPDFQYEAYKNFLESIGLSKSSLEQNKDKKYILIDYTDSGTSLENAKKFLLEENMLGNVPNLITIPIANLIGKDYLNKNFEYLFSLSRFKDYSYVGRLPIKKMHKVLMQSTPEHAQEFQGNIIKGVRKLFWFNVFDSLLSHNYTNVFPLYEHNALHEHYHSEKAINNSKKRYNKRISKCISSYIDDSTELEIY